MTNDDWIGSAIPKMAGMIARLDPGQLAQLRRGPLQGSGSAAFWDLVIGRAPWQTEAWAPIVQAIAILTPRGQDPRPAYGSTPMGKALHDAGVGDVRLARFLGAPRHLRGEAAVRMCRRLASSDSGPFNLVPLGRFVLGLRDAEKRIAREFYQARHRRATDKETR